jgi:hypothetical protein
MDERKKNKKISNSYPRNMMEKKGRMRISN